MPTYTFLLTAANTAARQCDPSAPLAERHAAAGFLDYADWALDEAPPASAELEGLGAGDLVIEITWQASSEAAARQALFTALADTAPGGRYTERRVRTVAPSPPSRGPRSR